MTAPTFIYLVHHLEELWIAYCFAIKNNAAQCVRDALGYICRRGITGSQGTHIHNFIKKYYFPNDCTDLFHAKVIHASSSSSTYWPKLGIVRLFK